ncbi:AP2 domain-containing protein [Clostridioides difficile]
MANYKFTDITGKRFGRLVAIERVGSQHKSPLWKCKCDCGNIIDASLQKLNTGDTKSCGCLKKDYYKNELANNIKEYQLDGTNVAYLKSNKLSKVNKSGVRGVSQKKNGKWLAQITFKRKNYNLGTYENFEDAVKARKEAEEKLFKPVLDKFKEARD